MTHFSRGITFIESLIWVAVFVVAMMALIVSLLSFYRANTYTLEQAEAVTDARRSIEHVIQTLREADYSNEGAYPIVSMSTSSVMFYADVDGDPFLERVHYYLDGTVLRRGLLDPTGDPPVYTGSETVSTVSPYVRNASQDLNVFRFFDENGDEITDLSRVVDVRFVRMDVIVNVSPSRLPNELTIRSSASLRNLVNEI